MGENYFYKYANGTMKINGYGVDSKIKTNNLGLLPQSKKFSSKN